VDTAEKRVHMDHPTHSTGTAANARTLLEGVVHDSKTQLYVLLAATSCVLLIGCVNVANLLVARSASRSKETSIRAALGSSRWRLIREQVTESLVLAGAGGALGLPLGWMGMRGLVESRPDVARMGDVHMDAAVVLFGLAMVAVSGVLAGLIPAVTLLRGPLLGSLQETSRANSASSGTARLRKVLLTVEVGFTVVLLTSAGLLLKNYQHLRESNLGCATESVLTMRFSLPAVRYDSKAKVAGIYEQLLPQLRSLPGVKAAGVVTALPGQGYGGDATFTIVENPTLDKGATIAMIRGADPGYFSALQIPLVRGRFFEDRERLSAAQSVIISRTMALHFFQNGDPLGKHLKVGAFGSFPPEGFVIVGVVGDTLWELPEPVGDTMYFPLYGGDWQAASIAVRSDQDVAALALPIQKTLAQLDPDLPVSDILTMDESIGHSTVDASFTSVLVLAFAVIALLLAAVGLYGVLSYLVTQRTAEIGIRIALGAQRGVVLRHMLLDGLRPAWIGLLLGLVASAFTARLIRDLLYGASTLDWSIFVIVAALLSLVAAIACALPAWRASRLDPMQALRAE
jgi:predicted permease